MHVTRSLFVSALVWCASPSLGLAAVDDVQSEPALKAARALAYEAQEAYDAGRYAVAAEAARAAQRLVSAPTLALLEARSLRQLGRFLAARAQYQVAAAPLPPGASEAFQLARQAAVGELSTLEDELPRLSLELRSPRSDTEEPRVSVDGAHWPTTSFGTWVAQDPGEHVVEATFGKRTERHLVRLNPRDKQHLLLGAPVHPGSGANLRAPLAISAFALSAVGLGTGIGFAVRAQHLREKLDGACPEAVCPPARADTLRNYRTARGASTAGYVVGAVGAATGVVVLALPASRKRQTGATSLRLAAGQLGLGGHF